MKHDSFPVTIRVTLEEIKNLVLLLEEKKIPINKFTTHGKVLRAIISNVLEKIIA